MLRLHFETKTRTIIDCMAVKPRHLLQQNIDRLQFTKFTIQILGKEFIVKAVNCRKSHEICTRPKASYKGNPPALFPKAKQHQATYSNILAIKSFRIILKTKSVQISLIDMPFTHAENHHQHFRVTGHSGLTQTSYSYMKLK